VVGEEVDVVAHPLDGPVSLQRVAPGENETVLGGRCQAEPGQTIL
jgi:hypothetical protein